MSFVKELKRRNVFRVLVAYLAASWLLIQIVETLFPVFGLSEASVRQVVIVLAIGFVPAVVLTWIFEVTPKGIKKDRDACSGERFSAGNVKALDRAIMVVLVLALGLFSYDKFILSPQHEAALIESATHAGAEQALEAERARASAIPQDSIAVLPFVNMSGDPQNEYFSDGLTETLLHMLAQLPDLKVSARTSVFAFKGQSVDVRTIAQALGVAHVLEGSVQKAGDRVRITAQLIRADDGFHIWSQHYDRTLEDIFAIQDEIAADVAATLGSALFAANADAIQGVSTADISAYDIYLHALEQQAINTNEALVMAVELFEEALAKDPDFVDARTALARNYLLMTWKAVLNEEIALSEASALLAEALEQRPDDLVARELDLVVKFHNASARIDIPAADLLFEELLPLMDEGYGDAYVRRFAVQVLTGKERYPEALAALRDGLIVDPLNYDLLWAQATIFMATERPEEAMQPLLTALKVAPDNPLIYWRLGMAALNRGELVDALNWVREASEVDPGDPVLTLILADKFYTLGLLQEGDRWAERTRAIAPGSEAAIEADIWAAVARDDHAKLLDLTQQLIDRALNGEISPGLTITATNYYSYVMHDGGRSQEALDYLAASQPGINDVTVTPNNWVAVLLQAYGFALRADVMDTDSFRALAATYVNTLDAAEIKWRDGKDALVTVSMWQGDLDTAKSDFLDEFGDLSPDHPWWRTILESPWLVEFREEPEVAARLAKVALEKDEVREQVRQMLQAPEWQHEDKGV